MVSWKRSILSLLLWQSLAVFAAKKAAPDAAEAIAEEAGASKQSTSFKVTAETRFPESEIFGVKLVNGHATQAVIDFVNEETIPVTVMFISGSLLTLDQDKPQIVRNLTLKSYNLEIPAGEKQSIVYQFATELHPQDLRLQLVGVLTDGEKNLYTIQAHNGTVSIVEAPTSLFDPQIIFLYLILAGSFAGTCYFIYSTWITTLFPQKRKTGGSSRPGVRPKKPEFDAPADGEDTATTTGAKGYDESWIPPQHLARPEAKRVRSGTPKTKTRA